MIVAPEITVYLDSLEPGNAAWLEALRREAETAEVPVLRRNTERFLKMLLLILKPQELLEVGTAVGYSALVMASVLPENAHITTIESWAPRIEAAQRNISRSVYRERITLLPGDAGEILPGLPAERYSFVFMDAAKGQYLNWLPHLLKCLRPGGIILSDNVLQEGSIAYSRFALPRRDRTIHARMREYLYVLTHTEGLETSILPGGDGIALTLKRAGAE